jgi:hypothetical protein
MRTENAVVAPVFDETGTNAFAPRPEPAERSKTADADADDAADTDAFSVDVFSVDVFSVEAFSVEAFSVEGFSVRTVAVAAVEEDSRDVDPATALRPVAAGPGGGAACGFRRTSIESDASTTVRRHEARSVPRAPCVCFRAAPTFRPDVG